MNNGPCLNSQVFQIDNDNDNKNFKDKSRYKL